jgi:RNA polymerase-associated protein CTR9
MELKADDWLKAKETFRIAQDVTAARILTPVFHLEIGTILQQFAMRRRIQNWRQHILKNLENFIVKYWHRGQTMFMLQIVQLLCWLKRVYFDVSKDIFTQVQEAVARNIFVQIPDVWVNLAHVYFAQGQFALAVEMYQNCLRKFYYGTDTQVLLYLARTHYEAEQWQDCKKNITKSNTYGTLELHVTV